MTKIRFFLLCVVCCILLSCSGAKHSTTHNYNMKAGSVYTPNYQYLNKHTESTYLNPEKDIATLNGTPSIGVPDDISSSAISSYKHTPNDIVAEASKYLGAPYKYGGSTPWGFDCSGFSKYIYSVFGYNLPRTSRDQYSVGIGVSVKSLLPGDLVFFGGRSNTKTIGHVGIVVKNNGGGSFDFIHASSRGVIIDSYPSNSYYSIRYIGARRLED